MLKVSVEILVSTLASCLGETMGNRRVAKRQNLQKGMSWRWAGGSPVVYLMGLCSMFSYVYAGLLCSWLISRYVLLGFLGSPDVQL